MSRTYKDEPCKIRAEKIVKAQRLNHDEHCSLVRTRAQEYLEEFIEIFYSHEIHEMEEFASNLKSDGWDIKTREDYGFLVTGKPHFLERSLINKNRLYSDRIIVIDDRNLKLNISIESLKVSNKKSLFTVFQISRISSYSPTCNCDDLVIPKSLYNMACPSCTEKPEVLKNITNKKQRTANRKVRSSVNHLTNSFDEFDIFEN